jgi:transposase
MSLSQDSSKRKVVFIGIDVHRKTYAICAKSEHFICPKSFGNIKADPKELLAFFKRHFSGFFIKSAYEAGFAGFRLHRELVANGIDNIVVNPASIEVAVNNKVKTDKRDAKKLSEHLLLGRLQGISIPSEKEELSRQYSRTRRQLVKHRTAIANQIKAKLIQFGFIDAQDDRKMSLKLLCEFLILKLPLELKISIQALAEVYKTLTNQVKSLNEEIKEQLQKNKVEGGAIYSSVPGVGPLSAMALASELGNMSQFANERSLFSYLGLTPSEYSSGETIRRGRITRQGRSELRGLLVEISWRAIRKDPELKAIYEWIKCRRGGKRAIVAVSRRLIGRIRSCLLKGEKYLVNYRTVKSQRQDQKVYKECHFGSREFAVLQ